MFVDYVTLLLVNMAAGLVILALFFWKGLGSPGEKSWAASLAAVGLVAFTVGLHMTLTWPIPKLEAANLRWANAAYGEMSVLLGVAFLVAALAVSKGWTLVPVTLYGCIAGAMAVLIGVRIMDLGLSAAPLMTGVGFILTGAAGALALGVALAPRVRLLRAVAAIDLLVSAGIWVLTAVMGYWMHLKMFSS